jgi:glycosyltransferase involved in cell wall biosynthesis
MGHNVFVFAQQADEYKSDEAFIFRYPSLDLPISVDIPAVIPVSLFADRLLPALKLDVIHTHHPVLLGQTAANKARQLKLPLVFTFHTQYQEYSHYFPLPQKVVQEFVKDMIYDWLAEYIQSCHHIIVPSRGMQKILEQKYGLAEGFTVIPTGIDLSIYQQADSTGLRAQMGWEEEKVVVSVGRLAKEKNWRTLLDAVALAREDHPDLRLALIGDGPERQALEKHAQTLGVASHVNFLGKIPFSEVPRYLKAADCFGFASITETQGLVTLEAIAAGLPVVAVDATGTSDIVRDGQEGYLTPNDSAALGEALSKLFQQPVQLKRFKEAALKRATSFDIYKQAERLIEVYKQAMEAQKQGRFVKVIKEKKKDRKLAGRLS